MSKYKVCGYNYDTESGEPHNGTDPGTKTDALPDKWFCHHSGANKNRFIAI